MRLRPAIVLCAAGLLMAGVSPSAAVAADAGPATRASKPTQAKPKPATIVIWGGGTMPEEIARHVRKLVGAPWTHPANGKLPSDTELKQPIWFDADPTPAALAAARSAVASGEAVGGLPQWLSLLDIAPVADAVAPVDRLCVTVPADTLLVVAGRRITVEGKGPITWRLPPAKAARDGLPRPATIVQQPGEPLDLIALKRTAAGRVAADPPTRPPAVARVDRGALLLCGGGDLPDDVWKRFIDLAGGPDAPIVFITSAQPDPFETDPKGTDRLKALGAKNVTVFGHRELASADASEIDRFYRALRQTKGVWLMGGRQWRYLDAYENTRVPELLRDVLNRGGVIGGTSAGAAVQADVMIRGSPLNNRGLFEEGYLHGFGLLPGAIIDIHVSERSRLDEFSKAVGLFPDHLGIAIDEATAALVVGSRVTALGHNAVQLVRNEKHASAGAKITQLRPGESAQLGQ